MRHRKHNHQLGVKTAHRTSMLANLCCSLIENGRIKTTLARARALRPTIEKIITLAKKAHLAQDSAKKIHYRRLAIARLRSKSATKKLFDELVEQFSKREGGYTRIYKLALPRLGDASEMALIEFVEEPASKKKKKKAKKSSSKKETTETEPASSEPEAKEAESSKTDESESSESETTIPEDAESSDTGEESEEERETTETDSSEEDAVAEVSDEEQVPHEEPSTDSEEDSKESK